MDDALKSVLVVELKRRGFTGSLPHFRRRGLDRISLLSVQHFSSGGSFVVEIAACPPSGFVTSWGKEIAPTKVKAVDIGDPRPRLGNPNFPGRGDHWFVYGPRNYETDGQTVLTDSHCVAVAKDVVALLDQAEAFWLSMPVSPSHRHDQAPRCVPQAAVRRAFELPCQ
jgi:hypothetical protein